MFVFAIYQPLYHAIHVADNVKEPCGDSYWSWGHALSRMTSAISESIISGRELFILFKKLSRLTNNGKHSVFWPPSCTYNVMTYVTWQRQDDVTYVKMCLASLVTIYNEAISAIGIIKKVTGEKRQGVVSTPSLGVRGWIYTEIIVKIFLHWHPLMCIWPSFGSSTT